MRPSLVPAPPCAMNQLAWAAPDEVFGVAKWYAPWASPAAYESLYCSENWLLV